MRSRGFTLVEVMISITILALLIVAVSPSIREWIINLRIRNATSALEQGLQQARQEAIRRNQSVSFWLVTSAAGDTTVLDNSCQLSNTSGSWVVSLKTPVGKCAVAQSTTVDPMTVASHAVGDGASGVSFVAKQSDGTSNGTTVTFNGLGTITNGDAIAKINVVASQNSSAYRSLCVELSGVGAVRLCDPALSSTDPRACKAACKV